MADVLFFLSFIVTIDISNANFLVTSKSSSRSVVVRNRTRGLLSCMDTDDEEGEVSIA